jgi:cytochrome c oxidase assembly protein subunit 11
MSAELPNTTSIRNRRVAVLLAGVAAGMVGLSFAAVPLYRLFCQITGYGGATQVAREAPGAKSERRIDARFDANVAPGLPWSFTAPKAVTVRLGEQIETAYAARNMGDQPALGVSTFNVTPEAAGRYFNKIQCFCFTEQLLMPGERKEFPLTFFVDPAIADDRSTAELSNVALSYTFFNAGPEALRRHLEKNPAVAARGSQDRGVP